MTPKRLKKPELARQLSKQRPRPQNMDKKQNHKHYPQSKASSQVTTIPENQKKYGQKHHFAIPKASPIFMLSAEGVRFFQSANKLY